MDDKQDKSFIIFTWSHLHHSLIHSGCRIQQILTVELWKDANSGCMLEKFKSNFLHCYKKGTLLPELALNVNSVLQNRPI